MTRIALLFVMTVCLMATARNQQANPSAASDGTKGTVQGLVRDISCPIQNHKAGAREFNLQCALDCARQGSPLIIQTDEGQLYVPISAVMPDTDQRPKMMPFVGKYVRVSGTIYEREGARAITVDEIKEMKDVHLVTDAN